MLLSVAQPSSHVTRSCMADSDSGVHSGPGRRQIPGPSWLSSLASSKLTVSIIGVAASPLTVRWECRAHVDSISTSKPAAASAAHARAAKVSADEPTHTQQHKRQHAADSRGEREPLRRSSLLDDGVGPVLTEVSASSRNVQSPVEQFGVCD